MNTTLLITLAILGCALVAISLLFRHHNWRISKIEDLQDETRYRIKEIEINVGMTIRNISMFLDYMNNPDVNSIKASETLRDFTDTLGRSCLTQAKLNYIEKKDRAHDLTEKELVRKEETNEKPMFFL